MNDFFKKLRGEAAAAKGRLKEAESALSRAERDCPHDWTDPQWDPIVTKGYQDPGDPPGTMGVDRRLPCWVDGTTTPRWTRECRICGKREETTRTQDEVRKHPVF